MRTTIRSEIMDSSNFAELAFDVHQGKRRRKEFKEGKRVEEGRKIYRDKEGREEGGRGVAKSSSYWAAVLFS